jgi:outer membrane lipoprotein-sorting protein
MRHRQGKFTGVLLVAALLTLLAGAVRAAEFSATIVTTLRGEARQGKIYIKGDKVRREFPQAGGTVIVILQGDKKIMWMLEPQTQNYLELPFDKEAFAKTLNQPKEGEGKKLVGTETLNGYATDKYETAVKTGTGTLRGTMWIAKKLGVPIRIETADKSFVEEYKDIKEGGVDDALFEIPAGYQKKGMYPGMPKP